MKLYLPWHSHSFAIIPLDSRQAYRPYHFVIPGAVGIQSTAYRCDESTDQSHEYHILLAMVNQVACSNRGKPHKTCHKLLLGGGKLIVLQSTELDKLAALVHKSEKKSKAT